MEKQKSEITAIKIVKQTSTLSKKSSRSSFGARSHSTKVVQEDHNLVKDRSRERSTSSKKVLENLEELKAMAPKLPSKFKFGEK